MFIVHKEKACNKLQFLQFCVLLYPLSFSEVQCVCSVYVRCRVCTRRRTSLAASSFSPVDLK